jgi:hypothetical protein
VRTNSSTSVLSNPFRGIKQCTQPVNAPGTISDGPSSWIGQTWWKVNFDTSCDGWVQQTSLTTTP